MSEVYFVFINRALVYDLDLLDIMSDKKAESQTRGGKNGVSTVTVPVEWP